MPASYATLLDDLADATDIVARVLGENSAAAMGQGGIVQVGRATARLERGSLSVDVLLVQIRSLIVDLLQVTGMDYEEAVAVMPRIPEELPGS